MMSEYSNKANVTITATPVMRVRAGSIDHNGLSAYQVAVKNGFVGTEKEWLKSLVGAKGEPGAVQTVNNIAPDSTGNVCVAVGAMSVNNILPDTSGNVDLPLPFLPLSGGSDNPLTSDLYLKKSSTGINGSEGYLFTIDENDSNKVCLICNNGSNLWVGNTSTVGTQKNTGGVLFFVGEDKEFKVSRNGTNQEIDSIVSSKIDNTGYIRLYSGLQVCWDSVTWTEARGRLVTVTFPMEFSSVPIVSLDPLAIGQSSARNTLGITSVSKSNFACAFYGYESTDKNTGMHYIAIGKWK